MALQIAKPIKFHVDSYLKIKVIMQVKFHFVFSTKVVPGKKFSSVPYVDIYFTHTLSFAVL
jgi:hypothetical protein